MKTLTLTALILLSFLSLNKKSISQWTNPVYLTSMSANYTGLSVNQARSIASWENNVYTVWMDSRWWTSGDIYFRRSTNGGVTWLSETVITNNEPESINPSIAAYNGTVHIVWEEYRDGNAEIYYKRSTNDGATWGSDIRLTNASGFSEFPAVSVSANGVHVAWRDNRDGNTEVYYKRSTNGGTTWGSDIRLTNNPSSSGYPSIATNGNGVHIAWKDYRNGNDEIYYKSSANNGTSWGSDTRLTNNTAVSKDPCITSSGLNLYIAYSDNRDGHYHIYLKVSTNLGGSWNNDIKVTNQYYDNSQPSISVGNNGLNIHIAYYYTGNNNFSDIFYIRSLNSGEGWSQELRLTQLSYGSRPHIALTGNTVHLINRWKINNYYHIQYWKYSNGNPTALSNTGTEIPTDFALDQNYPNPFNPVTNIRFDIPKTSQVSLKIYDITGKEKAVLLNKQLNEGTYNYDFNAENFSSGTYFYVLTAGDFTATKKMILIK